MFLEDADYFTRRALSQLGCAANAADGGIALVHARLSNLYLERARMLVEREMGAGWQGADQRLTAIPDFNRGSPSMAALVAAPAAAPMAAPTPTSLI